MWGQGRGQCTYPLSPRLFRCFFDLLSSCLWFLFLLFEAFDFLDFENEDFSG